MWVVVTRAVPLFRSVQFQQLPRRGPLFRLYSSTIRHNVAAMNKMEGVLVNWDLTKLTPAIIEEKQNEIIKKLKETYDTVAEVKKVSEETVLTPLLQCARWYIAESSLLTFPKQVMSEKEIREASTKATQILEEAFVDQTMRVDVFNKLVEFQAANHGLFPEQRRALEKLVKIGRRNGLHLSEDVRAKVTGLKKRIAELGLKFNKNLNDNKTMLLFTEEELAGVSDGFIKDLKREELTGKLLVSLVYPHFFPVTRTCRVPDTRKQMEAAFNSRCIEENTPILEEILELRQQEAELLGYKNHAYYAQEILMAQNPERVSKFLTELGEKLKPLWETEKVKLLQLKKEDCEKYGYEFNGKLDPWDLRYFTQKIDEVEFAVKQEELMEYFPLEIVTKGLLEIYQNLLGLQFVPLPDAPKWHPEVEVYAVYFVGFEDVKGYFYLDLHPREGKYGHACCVTMQTSCIGDFGNHRDPAVAAMLCNFSRPKNGKPALLDHKEVETFFHEFGHVMHVICSQTDTAMFAGAQGVERDFVECPSQMLENWVWHKEPLRLMSQHYKTKQPIPDDLLEKLVKSQKANAGGLSLRQVQLATFDQLIHSGGKCDTQAVFAATAKKITGMDVIPGTNMAATFSHVAGGYSARYYSYLWSEVFSMDMFKTVFEGGESILDPQKGELYRRMILQPGGFKDATEMLRDFLGREPNQEAFLESKGLS